MIEIEDFQRPPATFKEQLDELQQQLVELGYLPAFIKKWRIYMARQRMNTIHHGRDVSRFQTMTVISPNGLYLGTLVADFEKLKVAESRGVARNRHLL